MSEKRVYLDSSAIIKRYVKEDGSEIVKNLYINSYDKIHKIVFNIWNIGEVLGVFDGAL